jgi:LPXTG-motif cell wall-anchored protein
MSSDIKTRSGATTQPVTKRAAIPVATGTDTRKRMQYGTGRTLDKPETRPASMLFLGLAIVGGAGLYWYSKRKKSKR